MPTPLERDRETQWSALALGLVTVGAALLRLVALGAEELWFDEIFSAVLASQEPAELLRRALADKTNPPGFYLALWIWTRIGGFEVEWMRLLPAIAGIALVPAIAWLARTLGMSRGAALLSALLAAVSPLMLAMSVELRAYSLLALATVLALGAAVLVARGDGRRTAIVALLGADLALVSLHYFGVLIVAVTIVGIIWTGRGPVRDRVTLAVGAALPALGTLTLWILWVFVAAGRAPVSSNAAWVPSLDHGAVTSFASQVVGSFGTTWGAWFLVAALGAAITRTAHSAFAPADRAERTRARWLLAAACLPILLVLAGMVTMQRSLWVARYLIIVLPGCWLLLTDASFGARERLRIPVVAALAAWAAFAGPLAEASRTQKPGWSLLVRSLAREATVCVNEPFVRLPLEYHALASGVPLGVRMIADCAQSRSGDYALVRPGTEASLAPLGAAGAVLGAARPLHTRLPDLELSRLEWTPR